MRAKHIDIHKTLVDRCRKGDGRAQHELYLLYARSMYNVCMRITNNAGDAEDIIQESFLEAFYKITDFLEESSFGAWMKRIVINRSVNSLRKKKLLLLDTLPDTADVVDNGPHEEDSREWEVSEIRKIIRQLPDGYRLVISLYLLEGYDHSEIAGILNISESTSKSQYNRAKSKVREQLKKIVYAG